MAPGKFFFGSNIKTSQKEREPIRYSNATKWGLCGPIR
jgi:hypothetical protein